MINPYLNLKGYVCAIFVQDNKIFLLKRENTGFSDGYWALPGGTLEDSETLDQGIIREIKEELDVTLLFSDLRLAHVMLHLDKNSNQVVKFGYYFSVNKWEGVLRNLEPHLHSDIKWFDFDNLPERISRFTLQVINGYKNNLRYSQIFV